MATVRTSLHNDSHWDRLSAAIICNMLVKVSWMSLISLLSVSVSSMLNKTPGKPLSVITKPATSTKLHYRNENKPELNNQAWHLVINATTAKRLTVFLAVIVCGLDACKTSYTLNLTEMVRTTNMPTSGVIFPYNVHIRVPPTLDMISPLHLKM